MSTCRKLATNENGGACILHAVQDLEAVIVEKYGNLFMPTQLERLEEATLE